MSLLYLITPNHERYEGVRPINIYLLRVFYFLMVAFWLAVVAYPLWRTHTLAGSPAEALTDIFLGTPVLALVVPWKYVYQHYVKWPARKPVADGLPQARRA